MASSVRAASCGGGAGGVGLPRVVGFIRSTLLGGSNPVVLADLHDVCQCAVSGGAPAAFDRSTRTSRSMDTASAASRTSRGRAASPRRQRSPGRRAWPRADEPLDVPCGRWVQARGRRWRDESAGSFAPRPSSSFELKEASNHFDAEASPSWMLAMQVLELTYVSSLAQRLRFSPLLERKGKIMSTTTLVLLIALFVVLFGGGGGYYWSRRR